MGFKNDLQLRKIKYIDKALYVNDESVPNLYVRVLKTKKKFVYRYKVQGVIKEKTLGIYPQMSLIEARSEAETLNAIDKKESTKTLSVVYEEFKEMLPIKRRFSFEKHINYYLSDMPINEIARSDIITCLDKLAKKQKYETCKRMLQN